jgi:hypothetical protein
MTATLRNQNSADNARSRDTGIQSPHIKVDFWRDYDVNMGENPRFGTPQEPHAARLRGQAHAAGIIFPIARAITARTFLKCVHGARFDPPTGM